MKRNCLERDCREPQDTLEKLRRARQEYHECIGMTSDRLFEAYYQLHRLKECDFPEPLQPTFHLVMTEFTGRTDAPFEGQFSRIGDVRNTLNHCSQDVARHIVGSLSHLIEDLEVLIPSHA